MCKRRRTDEEPDYDDGVRFIAYLIMVAVFVAAGLVIFINY